MAAVITFPQTATRAVACKGKKAGAVVPITEKRKEAIRQARLGVPYPDQLAAMFAQMDSDAGSITFNVTLGGA
jgi:hypothetical protein